MLLVLVNSGQSYENDTANINNDNSAQQAANYQSMAVLANLYIIYSSITVNSNVKEGFVACCCSYCPKQQPTSNLLLLLLATSIIYSTYY
jgi:hypothetical protein